MPVRFTNEDRVINPPPSPRNSPRSSVTLRTPRTRQSGKESRSPKTHTSGRKRKTKVKNAKRSKRGSQKKRGRRASRRQRGGATVEEMVEDDKHRSNCFKTINSILDDPIVNPGIINNYITYLKSYFEIVPVKPNVAKDLFNLAFERFIIIKQMCPMLRLFLHVLKTPTPETLKELKGKELQIIGDLYQIVSDFNTHFKTKIKENQQKLDDKKIQRLPNNKALVREAELKFPLNVNTSIIRDLLISKKNEETPYNTRYKPEVDVPICPSSPPDPPDDNKLLALIS